jgi:excisionase family DNA binding protein
VSTELENRVSFEPLLDDAQAAGLLGIHPKTLQRLARVGEIPADRVGRFLALSRIGARLLAEFIRRRCTIEPPTRLRVKPRRKW